MIDFDNFTQLPKNVRDVGKLIVAKGFKSCPKFNQSPNLVTLGTANTAHICDPRTINTLGS